MNMKGTGFLARKKTIIDKFGQEAWDTFLQTVIRDAPFFKAPIIASSGIPIEHFLKFQEALVKKFYRGNTKAYWDMGAASAQWSLTEGPYRAILDKRDLPALVSALPSIWTNYYDEGTLTCVLENKVVHVRIMNVPVWHVSFELMAMGYFHRALELFTRRKVAWKQLGSDAPGTNVHYEFHV